MEKEELEHFLEVLIENDLAFILKLLTEGNFTSEEIDKRQLKEIISFINHLPEEYRIMKNRDQIIASKLKKMGIQTKWGQKKEEELKMKSKIGNQRKIEKNKEEKEK